MSDNLELSVVKSKSDVAIFWNIFDNYINELSLSVSFGDEFDLEYFYSDEYRDAVEVLGIRDRDPLRIIFMKKEEVIIGFLMYITYFDEGGKCLLMEYYIEPNHRNEGYGRSAYLKAEKYIHDEGALYIELTPTNESNERFWNSIGFEKSEDMDEDNKYYYKKSID